jgi:hypothetical protein
VPRLLVRLAGAAVVTSAVSLVFAIPVLAQVVPDPAPDAGLPGGQLITQVLGWLKLSAASQPASATSGRVIRPRRQARNGYWAESAQR